MELACAGVRGTLVYRVWAPRPVIGISVQLRAVVRRQPLMEPNAHPSDRLRLRSVPTVFVSAASSRTAFEEVCQL